MTNAAIFMPVLFVGGIIGVMFKEFAFVIITTLLASLAVALMLVPVLSHAAAGGGRRGRRGLVLAGQRAPARSGSRTATAG